MPDSAVSLRLLRAAEAVARHGSVAAAADELHLSRSAVSRAVAQAESQLGAPLFERGARGMSCTPPGQALLRRVARARQQLLLAAGPLLACRATDGMLQALAVVAEQRSESGAARQLGLTQAAVHQSLRQLEHAAREPLFHRSRRGTRLSEAGERVLLRAKLALAELRTGHDELAHALGRAAGRLAVGVLPVASDVLVPQALARLLDNSPGVQVTVADGTYEALLHQLRHGDVDVVVGPLRGRQAPPDVDEEELLQDPLVPVVRQGHPALLPRRRVPSLKGLLAWPWVSPLAGTPARAAFERAFAAQGLALPPVVLHANSPAVVRSVLMASDAVALLSPLQIRAELAAGLVARVPVPLPQTLRSIGIMQRRDALAPALQQAFLAELRRVARSLGVVGMAGVAI